MQAACDRCHRRKSRCDKEKPQCAECRKADVDCSYTDRTRDSVTRREQVDAVTRRLRQAEAKNEALASELARLKAAQRPHTPLPAALQPHILGTGGSSLRKNSTSATNGRGIEQATPASAPGGDVINEVSFLASNAAGDRHFLGSTSGVLFANLVRASVEVTNANQRSSHVDRRAFDQGIVRSDASYKGRTTKEVLPPEDLARKLISSYLAHDHIAYPILLPSYILGITDSIYLDTSYYDSNAFDAFAFDMVLAIANANLYKYDWQMLPSAESHHLRAMARVSEVFQAGGMKSLQAILLLCQYRTGSSIQDTSASMWHLVGIAVRIAYEFGLHHESSYLHNAEDANDLERIRDQEVRRRCFWCVFAFDRVVSITLGRPLAINIDDVNTQLPSTENDDIINIGLADFNSEFPRRTSIFVHIVQYRLLCGKIMRTLHGLKRADSDERQMYSLRDSLAIELDKWWQETDNLDLPEVGSSSPSPHQRSSFLSREWYEILYRNATLILFRPSPMLSDISKDPATLQKIFTAAKRAVLLYASLHRSRRINYSWITLHSVFMAGLSYIYAVSCHFRERRRQLPTGAMLAADPTTIEIVNDTRACSNVLVAVSERWNALRHCHEVFDRLSDAVLEDAIKLQCAPRRSGPSGSANIVTPAPSSHSDMAAGNHLAAETVYMHGSQQQNSNWYGNDTSMIMDPSFYSQTSPLAVDSEFRNCFADLQHLYNQQYNDDPVMQLSQDWLGYLDGF